MWSILPFLRMSLADQQEVYALEGAPFEPLISVIFVSIILSGILYSGFSLLLLRKHRRRIQDEFSDHDRINLNWLRYLIWGLGVIWLVVLIAEDEAIFGVVVLYVIFMGYFGISQVGIFSSYSSMNQPDIPVASTSEFSPKTPRPKYEKSALSDVQLHEIHRALQSLMKREERYRTPEITLAQIAEELQIHPNTLSQVINRMEGQNFFDYINGQRVDAFKRMASETQYQSFTLLAIALECGFNSKTSFNRNFKKATGMSPSQYLKEIHAPRNTGL
ncbi:AraC family transcriptional regulator [Pontibacter sp. G13]|uniref:helix-turn-helix domain-containing protein n=1 Tax=Pontibacter sp. G13 TaxID=3074898 RepID=UPI00288BBC32|nr:AraC family transcriptional regulator [Pontibacter sp. G13]WNJ19037.1 AraC family transcriptional regulator [Pontibacter sp. G13]